MFTGLGTTPATRLDGPTATHFHFAGEGGTHGGDQVLAQGNLALAQHATTGRTLRLFSTTPGPELRYLGAFHLDLGAPYRVVDVPMEGRPNHPKRAVLVFRLLPSDGQALPEMRLVQPLTGHAVVRQQEWTAPFRPGPGPVPPRALTSVEAMAQELLTSLSAHLRGADHQIDRYLVTPADELAELAIDLLDHTCNEIVVGCGSVARNHVLAAIGELLDMRRFVTPAPRLVLLAPTPLRRDLAELCALKDIVVTWPDAFGGFHRSDSVDQATSVAR